jgi:hypothetical protein
MNSRFPQSSRVSTPVSERVMLGRPAKVTKVDAKGANPQGGAVEPAKKKVAPAKDGKDNGEAGAAGKDDGKPAPVPKEPRAPKEPKDIKPNADGMYECKSCDKSFPDKAKLAEHVKEHSGDRPYLCQTCGIPAFLDRHACRLHPRWSSTICDTARPDNCA